MFKVDSLLQILSAVKEIRDQKRGFITNFFMDSEKINLWLDKSILFSKHYDETVFFLKANAGFYNTYFNSTDLGNLDSGIKRLKADYPDEIFISDLVGKETAISQLVELYKSNGFNIYTSLNRMNRLSSFIEELEANELIQLVRRDDFVKIKKLLFEYFDLYAEQLPLNEELYDWIDQGHLIKYEIQGEIAGFLIYDLIGITSYLRYWFVHPKYRNKNVGAALLKRYFFDSKNTKRQLFWVIRSNENAIKRYRHYGFESEDMVDFVMINKNLKYEENNT